jgi:hypothetical protein
MNYKLHSPTPPPSALKFFTNDRISFYYIKNIFGKKETHAHDYVVANNSIEEATVSRHSTADSISHPPPPPHSQKYFFSNIQNLRKNRTKQFNIFLGKTVFTVAFCERRMPRKFELNAI